MLAGVGAPYGVRVSEQAVVPEARTSSRGPGLPWPGVVVLVVVVTGVGVVVDRFVSHRLGLGAAVAYVIAAVLVALLVCRRDLVSAVVAPPVMFALIVAAARIVAKGWQGVTGTGLRVATELALLAPGLWIGTALALIIVIVRRVRSGPYRG